jgi:hypothetical protein
MITLCGERFGGSKLYPSPVHPRRHIGSIRTRVRANVMRRNKKVKLVVRMCTRACGLPHHHDHDYHHHVHNQPVSSGWMNLNRVVIKMYTCCPWRSLLNVQYLTRKLEVYILHSAKMSNKIVIQLWVVPWWEVHESIAKGATIVHSPSVDVWIDRQSDRDGSRLPMS